MTWHFGRESPRPLCEGVNELGWLVTIPRPLGESGFSVGRCRACGSGSTVRKYVNSFPQASKPVRWREAGNFPTPRIIQGGKCIEWLVASPRPLGERVEFLSELCELRNSGEGLNQELTLNAPLCTGKLFSDTLPLSLRKPFPRSVTLKSGKCCIPSPLWGWG